MNLESTPPAVRQLIENLLSSSNPEYIRLNHLMMLRNIRDCCQSAIEKYERQNIIK